MIFQVNEEIIVTNKTRLDDIAKALYKYNFMEMCNHDEIICYGRSNIWGSIDASVQLYFDSTKQLNSILIGIIPPNFNSTQNILIKEYGEPTIKKGDEDSSWEIENTTVSHCVQDHFGDVEIIFVKWK